MSLTRIGVESAMVGRLGAALTALNLSTVKDGTNADLNEPMAAGLDWFGVQPIDRSSITDADLANLDDSVIAQYLDLVEIRALESFVTAVAFGPRSQQWEDYKVDRTDQSRWILELIAAKTAAYNLRHGGTTGPVAVEMDCGVRDALRLRRDDPRCGCDSTRPGVWGL
jgi:hypothetical protein